MNGFGLVGSGSSEQQSPSSSSQIGNVGSPLQHALTNGGHHGGHQLISALQNGGPNHLTMNQQQQQQQQRRVDSFYSHNGSGYVDHKGKIILFYLIYLFN